MKEAYDVIVIGGGPAGTSTAIQLSRQGFKVAVLERTSYLPARIGETLPASASSLLAAIGIQSGSLEDALAPSSGVVSIWNSETAHEQRFDLQSGPGWHLDRNRFDTTLAEIAASSGVRMRANSNVLHCDSTVGGWEMCVENEGKLSLMLSRWAVDATGPAAWLAQRCGAKRIRWDHLVGVAGFGASRTSDDRTFLEAVSNGWWYAAQLPNGRCVATYLTDSELLPKNRTALRSFWKMQLRQTSLISSVIGDTVDSLKTVPANSSILSKVMGTNWIAVGDAAATYDPLSAVGISKALENACDAAIAISDAMNSQFARLQEYAKRIDFQFEEYLIKRHYYYSQVERWPDSSFWRTRQVRTHSEGRSSV